MTRELFMTLILYINSVICFVILGVLLWKITLSKKAHLSQIMIITIILIFMTIQILVGSDYSSVIQLFLLVLIIFQLFIENKGSNSTENESSQEVQEWEIIQRAKEAERSRIYANLHDDVGAKLLQLIYTAKDNDTKLLAKDILTQIRTAVASTTNIRCTLRQLFDEIDSESRIRLQAAGIKYNSKINSSDLDIVLAADIPSLIIRICREVMSNVIKHSKAIRCELFLKSNGETLELTIIDDGIGIVNKQKGKGLNTIQKRAEKLSATTDWKNRIEGGTEFRLVFKNDK